MSNSFYGSLFIKAGMLAATIGLVVWIGWEVPDGQSPRDSEPHVSASTGKAGPTDSHAPRQATLPPATRSPLAPVDSPVDTKVNLNRATIEELQQLPGIGPVLAQRIIARREAKGRYHAVEELLDVNGIGRVRLERLRPLLVVSIEPTTRQAPPSTQLSPSSQG